MNILTFACMLALLCVLFLLLPATACPQVRGVVVSTETGVPVRDVVLYTDVGHKVVTAWDGTYCLPDSFASVTLAHPKYERRVMLRSEMGDTINLIPALYALTEVVVIGRRRSYKNDFYIPKEELKMLENQSGKGGFSPGEMRRQAKKRQRQRLQRILDNY